MAIAGVGTKLYRWNYDRVPAQYEKVGEVLNISIPDVNKPIIDTTALDTTSKYRSFITNLKDSGNLNFVVCFDSDDKDPDNNETWYERFRNDFQASASNAYKVVFPDNSWMEIEGYVSGMPLSIPSDDKTTLEITLKITGIIDFNLS